MNKRYVYSRRVTEVCEIVSLSLVGDSKNPQNIFFLFLSFLINTNPQQQQLLEPYTMREKREEREAGKKQKPPRLFLFCEKSMEGLRRDEGWLRLSGGFFHTPAPPPDFHHAGRCVYRRVFCEGGDRCGGWIRPHGNLGLVLKHVVKRHTHTQSASSPLGLIRVAG